MKIKCISNYQETSIGKLVNSITSKEELGIGGKAAGLVDKWRRLIEEVVDKKYKSDEDSSPRQKPRIETSTKQSPQNSKKTESSELVMLLILLDFLICFLVTLK